MDKRLLYSAVLVASLSTNYAQAQVNDPVLPDPVQLKLDGTDTVAIKNVLADKWLTKGNAYGTQTSLGDSGLGFVIVPNKGDDGQPNGTYSFCNDRSERFGAFSSKIFVNSVDENGGNSYVDYASQGIEKTYWKVTPNGTTFKFQANEYPETYAGYNPNDTGLDGKGETAVDGLFRPALTEDGANGLEWQAYPYTYFYRLEKLKDQINSAIDEGLDVSAVEAIYNNPNAAYWRLKEAYRMINDIRRNKAMAEATAESPVNITEYAPDANCDALTGWTHECEYDDKGDVGHGGHGTNWQTNSHAYTAPDGYQTEKFIERWVHGNSDPVTGTAEVAGAGRLSDGVLSQTLHKLPAGGYKVTCYAMATQQVKGDDFKVEGVSVFADTKDTKNSQTVATKAGVPQKYEFLLDIKEGEDLTIGFKLDKCTANWVFVDNFQIEYCGPSFKAMNLNDVQKAAEDLDAKLAGINACPTYTDKAAELIESARAMTEDGTSDEEINTMKKNLSDVAAEIEKSSALYAELENLNTTIGEFLALDPAGDEFEDFMALYDDCGTGEGVESLMSTWSLNNEELTQYMADLKVKLENAQNASIKPGDDITRKIVNPSFDNGKEGWTVKEGNPTFNETYKNCEVYQGTFDIYQDITNIPDGVYELSVLAFQRVAENNVAYKAHDAGTEDITAFIYANDLETPFTSPYTYGMKENSGDDFKYNLNGEEVYIPNSMKGMAAATTENPDAYTVTVPMLVEDGTLRIGVREKRRPSNVNGSWGDWAIWDNFRLKYIGSKGEALNAVTTPLIAKAAGLLDSKMNAEVRAQLEAAKTALETEATVPGIHTLSAAIEAANTSIEAYKPLQTAIENAQTRYDENEASSTTSDVAKGLYNAAKTTAENIYNNGTAADAEIPAAIKALNEGVTKYVINDIIADASEAKPADITKVIANSDFATMSSTGWDVKDGTMAFQSNNSVEAGEFFNCTFNLQQTLVGLPAGMYRLTTQAFYRNGKAAKDGSDELKYDVNENAFIYFSDKEIPTEEGKKVATELPESKQAIKTITAHKIAEDKWNDVGLSDNGGLYKMKDGMYIPDNMITAQAFFRSEAGSAYDSEPLNFNYDGNSDFRIGLIKNVTVTNDWTIVKNFKLYYLGVDPTGISEIVTDANAVATKIYNASGMQIGKLQKGINIIETVMKDGSKKVKKVVVK
ncbi:hypothetical protein [Segatella hominis]|uniref:T9SS C-terminal target domain-containing protein n=1 Tax=Segatella hominis TaxID=2518605 RepID=A0A4Y8VQQ2_9BACT|nr:hypothetical protein [Segatella hominis]TFH82922.1 hypothetical protein EXN75_05095 [Segatella hominis]